MKIRVLIYKYSRFQSTYVAVFIRGFIVFRNQKKKKKEKKKTSTEKRFNLNFNSIIYELRTAFETN